MSSSLFAKNRQQSNQRWERKQTATNSNNDKFTFYAQTNDYQNNVHHQHSRYQNQKKDIRDGRDIRDNNQQYNRSSSQYDPTNAYNNRDSHKLSIPSQHNPNTHPHSQTPISRSQISKLRQTLQQLQRINCIQANQHHNSSKGNSSKGNSSKGNSRVLGMQNNKGENRDRDRDRDRDVVKKELIYSQNYQNYDNCQYGQNEDLNYEDVQESEKMDYNRKLDILKKRLEIISQKQYKNQQYANKKKNKDGSKSSKLGSPLASLNSKNIVSKDNSQQSTKRYNQYNIGNIKNTNYHGYKHHLDKQQLQDSRLAASKNTVPMPTIIHEAQLQLQTQHRISSTLQLQQKIKPYPTYHLEQPIRIKSNSYSNTLSQKKINSNMGGGGGKYGNQSQLYYELFPSMSEELDMRVYKDREWGPVGKEKKMQKKQVGKAKGIEKGYYRQPSSKQDKKSGQSAKNSRIQSKSNHGNAGVLDGMRAQLQKMQSSWLYNIAQRKTGSEIRFKQQQSNQHTKRKQSHADTRPVRSRSNPRTISQSKLQSRQPSYTKISVLNQKSPIPTKNQKPPQKKNININHHIQQFKSKETPKSEYGSKGQEEGKTSKVEKGKSDGVDCFGDGFGLHRGSVKDMIVQYSNRRDGGRQEGGEDGTIGVYSCGIDYQVRFTEIDGSGSVVSSVCLYRHRGKVTSLTKSQSILISTSSDYYLKHLPLPLPHPTSPSAPTSTSNSTLIPTSYKLPSLPFSTSFINQQKVLIGTNLHLYIFNLTHNEIEQSICTDVREYKVLENGCALYIGCFDKIEQVYVEGVDGLQLGNVWGYGDGKDRSGDRNGDGNKNGGVVCYWAMHPIEQYCIMYSNNIISILDISQPRHTPQIHPLPNLPLPLPQHTQILSHSWLSNNTIIFLTQQPHQTHHNQVINRLLLVTVYQDSECHAQYLQLISNRQQYICTVANSLCIIRTLAYNKIVLADKNGKMYIRTVNQPAMKSRNKNTNTNIDMNMNKNIDMNRNRNRSISNNMSMQGKADANLKMDRTGESHAGYKRY